MSKTLSITIKVVILAIIATIGILYIFNRSPVEDLGDYEKQEMVKPNRGKSVIDQFFTPTKKHDSSSSEDEMSLTGSSGRYDEVRIGKDLEE